MFPTCKFCSSPSHIIDIVSAVLIWLLSCSTGKVYGLDPPNGQDCKQLRPGSATVERYDRLQLFPGSVRYGDVDMIHLLSDDTESRFAAHDKPSRRKTDPPNDCPLSKARPLAAPD
jgi:hypothetical protein